tara:strand:- start:2 stop:652 length:651 start_codon:yes stop_codon:yes gene_type:complete
MGPADHKISEGQERIATVKPRDKHDTIIVQEKLDGSNVGVAMKDGEIFAISRAGYEAKTSPYEQHHAFSDWVYENEPRFRHVLSEGHRVCGEWLHTAHGTIYELPHEPFVAFDLFDENNKRFSYFEFSDKVGNDFVLPYLVGIGQPISVDEALQSLGDYGHHGATEQIEGAIWRVERNGIVDYLCKYVRPDKIDGKYLNGEPILNKVIVLAQGGEV